MSQTLQLVIALAVVVLTAFLVPLLLQLRRTAAALERFSESAGRDLSQVAADLHATRARVEGLADLAQRQMEQPGPLAQVVYGIARAIPAFLHPPREGGSAMDAFVTGLRAVLSLLRGNRPAATPEAPHER